MGETYKKLLFQRYGISGSLYNTFVIVTHRFLLQIGEFFLDPNIFLRLFSKLVNNFILVCGMESPNSSMSIYFGTKIKRDFLK